jgi:hypothetical protein
LSALRVLRVTKALREWDIKMEKARAKLHATKF